MESSEAQFCPNALSRDMTKAFMCFESCVGGPRAEPPHEGGSIERSNSPQREPTDSKPLRISTGNWGCGVFGGNRFLKFLQQLCAVSQANAGRTETRLRLDFSTFGDAVFEADLRGLLSALEGSNMTVGQLCKMAAEFGERQSRWPARASIRARSDDRQFLEWVHDRLRGREKRSNCALM